MYVKLRNVELNYEKVENALHVYIVMRINSILYNCVLEVYLKKINPCHIVTALFSDCHTIYM